MKVSNLLASLAVASALGFSGQASATVATVDLGNLNVAPVTNATLVSFSGLFSPDIFTFSLSTLSNVNVDFSSVVSVSLGSTFNLYNAAGTALIKSYAMPTINILGGPELIFKNLAAGSYQFKYNPGLFTGGLGTTINFSATPVPEPENSALMLLGLGLIGVIARRKFV